MPRSFPVSYTRVSPEHLPPVQQVSTHFQSHPPAMPPPPSWMGPPATSPCQNEPLHLLLPVTVVAPPAFPGVAASIHHGPLQRTKPLPFPFSLPLSLPLPLPYIRAHTRTRANTDAHVRSRPPLPPSLPAQPQPHQGCCAGGMYFICMAWDGPGSPASNSLIGKCSREGAEDREAWRGWGARGEPKLGGAGRDEMGVLKLRVLILSMWPYIILIKPAHPALTTAAVPFLSSCESHLFLISKITCLSNRDRAVRH